MDDTGSTQRPAGPTGEGGTLHPPPTASGKTLGRLNIVCAVLAAGLTVWVGVFLYQTRDWPLVHDAPLYHYVGWRISEGGAPYQDVIDMSLPGTYLIHFALVSISSDYDRVWQYFHVGVLMGTLAMIALMCRRQGLATAWAACLVFACVYFMYGPLHAGQRDFIVAFLELAALYSLARFLEKDCRGRLRVLLAGVLLGSACMIRPAAVYTVTLAAIYLLWKQWTHDRRFAAVAKTLGVALLGFAVPVAGLMLWLQSMGVLSLFIKTTWEYTIPVYAGRGPGTLTLLTRKLILMPEFPLSFFALAGWVLFGAALVSRNVTSRLALVMIAFAGAFPHFTTQRLGFHYHLYPMVLFGTILCCWHVSRCMASRDATKWGVGVALSCWMLPMVCLQAIDLKDQWRPRLDRIQTIVSYLRPRVGPSDTVQILDTTEGGLNVLLRLGAKQPTRVITDFQLFYDDMDHPFVIDLRKEFLDDLKSSPPKHILMFERGWPGEHGYERLDRYPEFAKWLHENYDVAKEWPNYRCRVYERRPPDTASAPAPRI